MQAADDLSPVKSNLFRPAALVSLDQGYWQCTKYLSVLLPKREIYEIHGGLDNLLTEGQCTA
jgi:hypothetical protein